MLRERPIRRTLRGGQFPRSRPYGSTCPYFGLAGEKYRGVLRFTLVRLIHLPLAAKHLKFRLKFSFPDVDLGKVPEGGMIFIINLV